MTSLATSPRALTPTQSSTFGFLIDEAEHATDEADDDNNGDTWRMDDQLEVPPSERMVNNGDPLVGQFVSAEQTLRELLMESNRIKEMVSEAEMKARSWLQTKTVALVDLEDTADVYESGGSDRPTSKNLEETVGELADSGDEQNNDIRTVRFRQRPAAITVSPSGESIQEQKPKLASPLKTVPSYVDLYNEELIETNKRCYMQ